MFFCLRPVYFNLNISRQFKAMQKENITVIIFTLLCIILWFTPTGFENSKPSKTYFSKAKVQSVDNRDLRQHQVMRTGIQDLMVEMTTGPHKGTKVKVINPLSGKLEVDEIYKKGDTLLIEYQESDGVVKLGYARGHYRLNHELLLVVCFFLFLLAVAGTTGLKAILSLLFATLTLWKVLIPLFLKDVDPILVAIGVVAALSASVSFLVGGLTRKGLTAFLGSFAGLMLACILAKLFAGGFSLNGAVRPYAENLLYTGYAHLNLMDIFLAGIFIACSGAVMDLAMDIAASISEVKSKKPDIGMWELFQSGMTVGRAVIGTMTTTLLLAYSGGYTAMLMNFMSMGYNVQQILNLNHVAAEILNIFVGSFGLVAVAPFTAIIGALLYSTHRKPAMTR